MQIFVLKNYVFKYLPAHKVFFMEDLLDLGIEDSVFGKLLFMGLGKKE